MDRGDLAQGVVGFVVVACLAWALTAHAGHEMPFYPSYYPQEITLEALSPAAAAPRIPKSTVHAYVGADLWPGRDLPAGVGAVESLGSYVVITSNPASRALATKDARCDAVRSVVARLREGGWIYHPHPVTPYHPDYLNHVDVTETARQRFPRAGSTATIPSLRVRANGKLAERALGIRGPSGPGAWDVAVEEIPARDLVSQVSFSLHGGVAPPWVKEGWFQAFALMGRGIRDPDARAAAGAVLQRLTSGAYAGTVERLNLERALLRALVDGCERVVAGYTLQREVFTTDYSAGVENVAADSATGLNSAIFLRTVKLRDFPWNGWITLGVPARPAAAWNPLAGFTDATGRLLWSAVADPAFFPEPYGPGWVENRVRLGGPVEMPANPIAVPKDALLPDAGTGLFKPVGEGKTARAKLTYRVLTSAFHDGTRMTVADALYGLSFSFKWSGGQGAEHDPEIARATAMLRGWLSGLQVLRVETDVLRFGEIAMKYEVPIIEVYLAHGLPHSSQLATVAPPWSPVPWHALALMEEAVRRGLAAFSADEARRRGVPWLDVVRDDKLRPRLLALLGELEGRAYVPAALAGMVTEREARNRWGALRQFAAEHGHLLVTSGPYQVHAWSSGGAVLRVFRDFSYPLGVGSFNRYPIPLKGSITNVEVRPDRLEVHAEAERVERFGREYRLVTEPVGGPTVQKDRGAAVVCRYVVVNHEGAVLKVGEIEATDAGVFVVRRDGWPPSGRLTVLLAIAVSDNHLNPRVRAIRIE